MRSFLAFSGFLGRPIFIRCVCWGKLSSLQGLQKCCRENLSWNCVWKSPWKMPRNFWWNFAAPLSSGNEARKRLEFFTTNFTPLFTRRFAAANTQFHGVFHSADVCPWELCSTLALWGCQTPVQYWIKIVRPWVQTFYPVLGLGSGEGLPGRGFQIVERAAFSSGGNLLLQRNSCLKSTLRLLLRRRVWGQICYLKTPLLKTPHSIFPMDKNQSAILVGRKRSRHLMDASCWWWREWC